MGEFYLFLTWFGVVSFWITSNSVQPTFIVLQLFPFFTVAGLSIGFFAFASVSGNTDYFLVSGAFCAPAIALLPGLLQKRYDPMMPMNLVAVSAVAMAIQMLYIVAQDNQRTRYFLKLGIANEDLSLGVLAIVIGITCTVVGYFCKIPTVPVSRLPLASSSNWSPLRLSFAITFLMLLSLVSVIIFVMSLGLSLESLQTISLSKKRGEYVDGLIITDSYFRWGASLTGMIFLLISAYAIKAPTLKNLTLLGFFGLLALPFPIFVSSRILLLLPFASVVFCIHYLLRRLSWWSILLFITIFVTIFVSLAAVRKAGGDFGGIMEIRAERYLDNFLGNRDLLDASKTALIMRAVPDRLPYQLGKTMVTWAVAPVPRRLWKDKPIIQPGTLIYRTVYHERSAPGGVPPGFIAELYLNGGWLFVLPGMFCYGVVLRTLYDSFTPVLCERNGLMLYIVLIVPLGLTLPRADVSTVVIDILRGLIVIIPLLAFLTSHNERHVLCDKPLTRRQIVSAGEQIQP